MDLVVLEIIHTVVIVKVSLGSANVQDRIKKTTDKIAHEKNTVKSALFHFEKYILLYIFLCEDDFILLFFMAFPLYYDLVVEIKEYKINLDIDTLL